MDKFKNFSAVGKHNISFQVHQYIADEHPELNKEVPSAFAHHTPKKANLNEEAAHYFVQAIIHRQDLLRIKAKSSVSYFDDAAVILLRRLADDSYRLSTASEFDDIPSPHTEGAGNKSFDEQYEYYRDINLWVLGDAKQHIISGSESLQLSRYWDCFEYGEYIRHYEFVNDLGIQKLRDEWPEIWRLYELDKYVT